MTPLADTHVHLLAGLDDGPPAPDVALAMCRMLLAEGARHATALAHQNHHYPANTADHLRAATAALKAQLAHHKLPLAVHPTGEVMVSPSLVDDWLAGTLLSVGDHKQFLLVEMPHGQTINLLPLAEALAPYGVRLILAHAERYELLLDDLGLCAKWIAAGVLFQVTARALAEPWEPGLEVALKRWAKGGFIHLLGSDGHGIDRRRPVLAGGFGRLVKWLGRAHAARIAGEWGRAVLEGRPVKVPKPRPDGRSWFTRVFGS
ncbi:MAG: protein tyrosine phosphatase [Planctomycetes bacterium]|nr:protein tyrosine phosphatase [Planctomycetota bacterium]